MPETSIDALTLASRGMPLPTGAKLVFVPVEPASLVGLPEVAQQWAERRRNSFAAGRRAAGRAFMAAGYEGSPVLGIAPDGLPDWPQGWFGSISHTDTVAAAVVMRSQGTNLPVLGLDVERIVSADTAAEIAAAIMPEALPGASGLPLNEEITRAFSAKEALYKALYPHTRQFRGFEAARVGWPRRDELGSAGLDLTLTEDWGPDWPSGMRLTAFQTIAADHVVTIVWRQTG